MPAGGWPAELVGLLGVAAHDPEVALGLAGLVPVADLAGVLNGVDSRWVNGLAAGEDMAGFQGWYAGLLDGLGGAYSLAFRSAPEPVRAEFL